MKPKVTIGICGMNCADIVSFALNSVARQDYPHEMMEILFVDDGSQDNTLSVVKKRLSRIDIPSRIFADKWRGLGKARNTVIAKAEGEYIVWLDSDETLVSDFIRRQVALLEQNPKAGIATARLGIVSGENVILFLDLLPSVADYSTQDWKNPAKLPGTGGATYRVVAAREVGGFDESIEGTGEDIELASRIRRAGWLILRGDSIFYEVHGQMATWRTLWRRYVNHGTHGRRLYFKDNTLFSLYRINPIASFIAGVRYALISYLTTRRKVTVLLPFHFVFKMTAWFYGFSRCNE